MQRIIRRQLHTTSVCLSNNTRRSLPTDFFQKSLPFLSYPNFEETFSHFLERQSTVTEAKEFRQLQKLTNDFVTNDGKVLNQMLFEEYKQNKSVYGGYQYLDSLFRWRIPLIQQTYGCMISQVDNKESQLEIAAKLLYVNGMLQKSLRDNTYKPFMYRSNPVFEEILLETPEDYRTQVALALGVVPFDMQAYKKTLSGTRIPGFQKDKQHVATDSKNVVIIRNGNMFSFDLIKPTGNLLTTAEILMNLEAIKQQSEVRCNPPVAVLTAMERDMWAAYRHHMLLNEQNAKALKTVEDAITVLTLDGDYDPSLSAGKIIGYGAKPGDRWFDKNIAISVDESQRLCGGLGNSTETHAALSANVQDAALDIFGTLSITKKDVSSSPTPIEKLTFVVDDKLKEGITLATKQFYEIYNNYECVHFEFEGFSRHTFGRFGLSPDSLMHVALQITFMKLLGRPQNVITPVMVPAHVNSHYGVTFAPWKSTVELAKMYHHDGKLDFPTLRLNSSKYIAMLMRMRLGSFAPETHLRALHNFSLITGIGHQFFESVLYARSMLSCMDAGSVPNMRVEKMMLTGFDGAMAFGYLIKKDKFFGTITSGDKDKPSVEAFKNAFLETIYGLHHEFVKLTS